MAYDGIAHRKLSPDQARANQSRGNHNVPRSGPRWCVRCGLRWKQDGDLCRQCSTTDTGYKSTRERDAERLERQRTAVPPAPPAPVSRHRFEKIDGIEYEIWNGDHWYGDKEKCTCGRSSTITTGTA